MSALVDLHDKIFEVASAPPCYLAPCGQDVQRCALTKGAINRILLDGALTDFGLVRESAAPLWAVTYFSECRPNILAWAPYQTELLLQFKARLEDEYPLMWLLSECSWFNLNASQLVAFEQVSMNASSRVHVLLAELALQPLAVVYRLVEQVLAFNGMINIHGKGEALLRACDVQDAAATLRKAARSSWSVRHAFELRASYIRDDLHASAALIRRTLPRNPETTGSGSLTP